MFSCSPEGPTDTGPPLGHHNANGHGSLVTQACTRELPAEAPAGSSKQEDYAAKAKSETKAAKKALVHRFSPCISRSSCCSEPPARYMPKKP